MKEIKIFNSKRTVLVDDEDYDRVNKFTWNFHPTAVIRNQLPQVKLANFIMNNYKNMYDHKDRDIANNQKYNLRVATKSQNNMNKTKYDLFKEPTSEYKGVNWHKQHKKWCARIQENGKRLHLGLFKDEKEAALAYNEAAVKYFGEFAVLNKIKLS